MYKCWVQIALSYSDYSIGTRAVVTTVVATTVALVVVTTVISTLATTVATASNKL